jgi:hypothetical protein
MMMGIGTPSSQSRIPRPMELSFQPVIPDSHNPTAKTGITGRSSTSENDHLAADALGGLSWIRP